MLNYRFYSDLKENAQILVSELTVNVDRLIEAKNRVDNRLLKLTEDNASLKKKLIFAEEEIAKLRSKLDAQIIANELLGFGEDREEAIKKIDAIIGDIKRSITLFNM